ncbi:hypothetical protein [Ruoffia tabacinasalis]
MSYYIATINIEETFKDVSGIEEYHPFEGIVLTDTFESTELEEILDDDLFDDNNRRLQKQLNTSVTVIMGNPPYSVGQSNANDNNKNKKYENIDRRIENTYSKHTTPVLKRSLYDSYIKAFRWASDRIGTYGVIGFVTPNSINDKGSMAGFKKVINEKFNHIYTYNLIGAIKGKIGDDALKEGGSVFDIMIGTAITILVKDNTDENTVNYFEVASYQSKEEKLESIKTLQSINNCLWQYKSTEDCNEKVHSLAIKKGLVSLPIIL